MNITMKVLMELFIKLQKELFATGGVDGKEVGVQEAVKRLDQAWAEAGIPKIDLTVPSEYFLARERALRLIEALGGMDPLKRG